MVGGALGGHRRLTIGHELGHYHMPDHIERLFPEGVDLARSFRRPLSIDENPVEVEADHIRRAPHAHPEPCSVTGGDPRHALGSAVSIDAGIEHPVLPGESRTIAGVCVHQRHSAPHGGRLHPLGASRSFAPRVCAHCKGRLPLGMGGCGRR